MLMDTYCTHAVGEVLNLASKGRCVSPDTKTCNKESENEMVRRFIAEEQHRPEFIHRADSRFVWVWQDVAGNSERLKHQRLTRQL